MKKYQMILVMMFTLFLMGFGGKFPGLNEGVYPVKLKNLTYFDLAGKDLTWDRNLAELTESKPDSLEVGLDYEKLSDVKFGGFKLGNSNKKVWFLMGKDGEGYWTEVYFDKNLDNRIDSAEKVKSFQTFDGKYKGFKTKQSFSLIPVPVKVVYKGLTGEIERNLYFFFTTTIYVKKDLSDTISEVLNASFLEGEMKVTVGSQEKLAKFRIIDANSNGCFNDYGKDLLFIDFNYDGYYRKNESQKIMEYFNYTVKSQPTKQLKMVIPPYPVKIGIVEAGKDIDLALLEPQLEKPVQSEPDTEKEENLNSTGETPDQTNDD